MGTPNSPEGTTSYIVCLEIAKLHNLAVGSRGLGGQAYNYTDGGGTHAFSVSGGGGGVLSTATVSFCASRPLPSKRPL